MRTLFFLLAITKNRRDPQYNLGHIFHNIIRFLFPYYRAFAKRPLYATIRYIFHLILIILPVWLLGHIVLWEESRFSFTWVSLPHQIARGLTISFIALVIYFLIRKIAIPSLRKKSNAKDYVLITVTVLPFISGYLYSHGGLETIPFIDANIASIHALSGEILLIFIPFIFLKIDLDETKCIGCGACTVVCPTQTLKHLDIFKDRVFSYSHFQCISCGTCVRYCPESAAILSHDLSLTKLFQPKARNKIFTTRLIQCSACGLMFAPEKQIMKLKEAKICAQVLQLCPRCRGFQANFSALNVKKYHYRLQEKHSVQYGSRSNI